jgi:hypothetical protein
MNKTRLKLEVSTKFVEEQTDIATGKATDKNRLRLGNAVVLVAPLNLDKDYWQFRVKLGNKGQAIVGFPKFGVIGIGFALETDWNTNLPSSCDTDEIFNHIAHNKGDNDILDSDVKIAIGMVQKAAKRWAKYEQTVKDRIVWEKDPFMREGDRLLTLKEFSERCHLLRASKPSVITRVGIPAAGIPDRHFKVRKYAVLFGLTSSPYSWKYKLTFYCKDKKEAFKRAYQSVVNHSLDQGAAIKYPLLEYVEMEYNGKVPICF